MVSLGLPIDLEREIFECAALSRPKRIDRQPIFLRQPLIQVINSKLGSFFGDSVRHLMIPHVPESDTEGQFILSACTGVEDLWIYELPPYLLPFTRNLRLKRLHCGLTELFTSKEVDFTHPLFANITHLELIDSPEQFDQENGHSEHISPIAVHQDNTKLMKDPRFVVMQCEEFEKDWQMGAHTGEDYWARADAFVAKRRSGDVGRLMCLRTLYEIESSDHHGSPAGTGALTRTRTRQNPYPRSRGSGNTVQMA
ncbi:hypothetical protein C8F04DRAFT_1238935 [Mycena alexandri]|uniref:Uncharacterized protein n=1 Tax=Mycena alexandri TaxID=1745969 RepID=A0AAD6SDA2_9AGAR|nr:hypothetical protein C8F04DRAFT_1238935 [Mycena alexandri]